MHLAVDFNPTYFQHATARYDNKNKNISNIRHDDDAINNQLKKQGPAEAESGGRRAVDTAHSTHSGYAQQPGTDSGASGS